MCFDDIVSLQLLYFFSLMPILYLTTSLFLVRALSLSLSATLHLSLSIIESARHLFGPPELLSSILFRSLFMIHLLFLIDQRTCVYLLQYSLFFILQLLAVQTMLPACVRVSVRECAYAGTAVAGPRVPCCEPSPTNPSLSLPRIPIYYIALHLLRTKTRHYTFWSYLRRYQIMLSL